MLKRFFDALDTPGGHICTCIGLMVIGAVFIKFMGIPMGTEIIAGSFAVLTRSMFGANGKGIVGVSMSQSGGTAQGGGGPDSGGASRS